jgi:hypothetical protein
MTVQNQTTSRQLGQIYLKESRTHELIGLLFYVVVLKTLSVMKNILRAFFIYHKYMDHICQYKKILSETHFWHMKHVTFIKRGFTEEAHSMYFRRSGAYIIRFKFSLCLTHHKTFQLSYSHHLSQSTLSSFSSVTQATITEP